MQFPLMIVVSAIVEIKGPEVLFDVVLFILRATFIDEAPPDQIFIGSGKGHVKALIKVVPYAP
jgi:hypothetical protein